MARNPAGKEGYHLTLKRREKRRYISVMHNCPPAEALIAIERRLQDLYGVTALERASLKNMTSGDSVSIFRCALGSEEKMLVAIALTAPAMVTLDMSSSAKRLKRRLTKVNTALSPEKNRG